MANEALSMALSQVISVPEDHWALMQLEFPEAITQPLGYEEPIKV